MTLTHRTGPHTHSSIRQYRKEIMSSFFNLARRPKSTDATARVFHGMRSLTTLKGLTIYVLRANRQRPHSFTFVFKCIDYTYLRRRATTRTALAPNLYHPT